MICNEDGVEKRSMDINTLWNDELEVGKPICRSCTNLVSHLKNWNYFDRFTKEIKKAYLKRLYEGMKRGDERRKQLGIGRWL